MKYAVILAILLTACVPVIEQNVTANVTNVSENISIEEPVSEDTTYTRTFTEGQLARLRPEAVDEDEDAIRFEFEQPFDANGNWQTRLGDEGTYYVRVAAIDSKGEATFNTIRVVIERANRPPIVECQQIIVNEGEQLNLHDFCTISDEEDGDVVAGFSGWTTSARKDVSFTDAGQHTVVITASDSQGGRTVEEASVTVRNVNRQPVFDPAFPTNIEATEQDVITLPMDLVSDPDNDPITLAFSPPFSENGVWRTELGDAGPYNIDVLASDGENTATHTVSINLKLLNTPPRLEPIPPITVDEGQTVRLPISATDREGDDVSIDISGWMTTMEYKTTYQDAGQYKVLVRATDGEFTTDQEVSITVRDVNRPPVFVVPA